MAAKGGDNAFDEIIDTKCCVCAGKNLTGQAEKYCVQCRGYYCIPCTDSHKADPLIRGHTLLDKSDFRAHSPRSLLPCFPTERCPLHKTQPLDIFCKKHDEVVCATCVVTNHRTCEDINFIVDDVDNLYKQSAFDLTKKQLLEAKKSVDHLKKEKHQMLNDIKKQKQRATDFIINYRQELEVELKRLETESIKNVNERYKSIERDLQREIKELETQINDLEQSVAKMKTFIGNKAQAFACAKAAQNNIIKTTSFTRQTYVEFSFSADFTIKPYLIQLKTLGQVSIAQALYTPRATAYKVTQQRNINIKLKEDNHDCCIFGSCFTEDGSLVLADYNDNKLKCLNVSTDTIVDHLDLEGRPICVCLTSKQEAAVSMNIKTIHFVSLGDNMATTRKLKMDHHCFGLAFNAGNLFISDENKFVYIHDISGTLLRKITAKFNRTRHISMSTNKKRMYVADKDKGLITLDKDGNYLSTFTYPDLVTPQGVCTDKRGNILICGYLSSNILQISEDYNTKLGIIKTEQQPLSVCFDPHQNKLAVTHYNNAIRVYEME